MEQILTMISKWEPIGQGLFFLVILGSFFTAVYNGMFYLSVLLRGWPTKNQVAAPDEEE